MNNMLSFAGGPLRPGMRPVRPMGVRPMGVRPMVYPSPHGMIPGGSGSGIRPPMGGPTQMMPGPHVTQPPARPVMPAIRPGMPRFAL
ncbi:U1 small nuclear ribonucleoprotein C-like [Cyprinus carpio]|uniref:U1 small nuclear ribonucleoprotein C-like n=1 Tax=Cyprinus carpio TaxID=7962 RepID=A0A9Q9Y8G9_CYPCA|nr:U1 small nuclear ribonucleoprotein C-like [Cyprinus carpio]